MNATQLLMTQLQNQLKAKNPQMFQQFQNLQKNQSNPQELISNMIGKYKPEQISRFKQYANGFGITNEQLEKYGIK